VETEKNANKKEKTGIDEEIGTETETETETEIKTEIEEIGVGIDTIEMRGVEIGILKRTGMIEGIIGVGKGTGIGTRSIGEKKRMWIIGIEIGGTNPMSRNCIRFTRAGFRE